MCKDYRIQYHLESWDPGFLRAKVAYTMFKVVPRMNIGLRWMFQETHTHFYDLRQGPALCRWAILSLLNLLVTIISVTFLRYYKICSHGYSFIPEILGFFDLIEYLFIYFRERAHKYKWRATERRRRASNKNADKHPRRHGSAPHNREFSGPKCYQCQGRGTLL